MTALAIAPRRDAGFLGASVLLHAAALAAAFWIATRPLSPPAEQPAAPVRRSREEGARDAEASGAAAAAPPRLPPPPPPARRSVKDVSSAIVCSVPGEKGAGCSSSHAPNTRCTIKSG